MADIFEALLAHDLAAAARHIGDKSALERVDEDGRTPLIVASCEGLVEAVSSLLDAGASIDAVDLGGRNAFLTAAAEGHAAVIDILLQKRPALLNSRTKSGNTALHRAAAYGQTHLIAKLAAAGAAAATGAAAAASADAAAAAVNARNSDGATPLGRACRWGHADTAAALLSVGADPSLADNCGKTPQQWARAKGHAGVLDILTLHAASPAAFSPSAGFVSSPLAARVTTGGEQRYRPHSIHATSAVGIAEGDEEEEDEGEEEESAATSRAGSFDATGTIGLPAAGGSDSYLVDGSTGSGGGGADTLVAQPGPGETIIPMVGRGDGGSGDPSGAGGAGGGVGGGFDDEGFLELGSPMHVEGWMAKQGHIFKTWKNRWFVLDGRRMAYYSKEGAKVPKGVINMIDGTDVIIEEKYPKPFCYTVITPTKRFVLQAADEDEMAEWIEAIQNNLECCSSDTGNAVPGGGGGGGGDADDE